MATGDNLQDNIEQNIEQNIETVSRLIDTVVEFAVAYGFQILGALVVLLIGLKVAGWSGRKITGFALARNIDQTLAKFFGGLVKIVVIAFVVVITLGNFGISIAPLIALAGASAFGATLAIQGPLSNYGAGLSLILARPFVVGNSITVGRTSGIVEEITLAMTVLTSEDGERITVPNKEIVGEVIVNSHDRRVVETGIAIGADADAEKAIGVLREVLARSPDVGDEPPPQIGVHDFTDGGVVLGLRFWVPSTRYFQLRYALNREAFAALRDAGIPLLAAAGTAVAAETLSADEPVPSGPAR